MKLDWHKLGHIFKVEENHDWMHSHTTPIAAIGLENCIRVFFCTRSKQDEQGNFISYSSFLDVDKEDPLKILYIHDQPVINLGRYGAFDEFGVMVTDVQMHDQKLYLYYAGWQRLGGGTAAYQVMLGLAISEDDGFNFKKVSEGPVMSIDYYDPISIGNVAVLKDKNTWRLYYTSLTEWFIKGQKPTYEYEIKYAESEDGIFWKKEGKVVLGTVNGHGVATPSAIKYKGKYHMWFGYRKAYNEDQSIGGYLIGYAFSENGTDWIRNDGDAVIGLGKEGWDSEMICYPSVVDTGKDLFLFYCGNKFGKDGFGVAKLNNY